MCTVGGGFQYRISVCRRSKQPIFDIGPPLSPLSGIAEINSETGCISTPFRYNNARARARTHTYTTMFWLCSCICISLCFLFLILNFIGKRWTISVAIQKRLYSITTLSNIHIINNNGDMGRRVRENSDHKRKSTYTHSGHIGIGPQSCKW